MSMDVKVTTNFFVIFRIKKSKWGRQEICAARLVQKRPSKIAANEFFTKMTVSVPEDYLKRPEPTATLDLDADHLGDFPMLVAEKLRG